MNDGRPRKLTPFLASAKLIEKERRAEYSRQHKADGYDLFVTSQTDGAPRPPQGASEKHEDRKAGVAACGRRRTDRTMRLPYSYSPSVQPYSGGEASQAIGRVAREPREGEIPVELTPNSHPYLPLLFVFNH